MNSQSLTNPDATEKVTPDSLGVLLNISGVGALVRDQDLRVRWCNEAFAALSRMTREQMLGTTLHDLMLRPAADERESILAEVISSGNPKSLVQFGRDKRLLCRVIPIDEESFGHRGVLCLITEGPLSPSGNGNSETPTLIRTPFLDDLAVLTRAELRTLFDIACGKSNQHTADRQFRSVRTIENHVESIHRKLETTTRSALVRFATERGVHGFTAEQWDAIVEGSTKTRRTGAALKQITVTD